MCNGDSNLTPKIKNKQKRKRRNFNLKNDPHADVVTRKKGRKKERRKRRKKKREEKERKMKNQLECRNLYEKCVNLAQKYMED